MLFQSSHQFSMLYNNFEMLKQSKSGNFVHKLEKLLKNQQLSDIIAWDSSKTSIDVLDIPKMETEIIPKYFRHQKFQSFVRQLNLYGFRKIKLQGRHRFTHSLLLNGHPLSSITAAKSFKPTKDTRQQIQSPVESGQLAQQRAFRQIPLNSIAIQKQEQKIQTKNIEESKNECHDSISRNKMSPNTFFMIPSNYFNLWNMMPMMAQQNIGNMINYGAMMSYQ